MLKISDFIYTVPDTLSEDFCKRVIEKFEKDDRKHPGYSSENNGDKKSTDLLISSYLEWEEEDKVFFKSLSDHKGGYYSKNLLKEGGASVPFNRSMTDTGYQVQRTKPGEYFKWHHDQNLALNDIQETGTRVLVFMWYLNNVQEGGYTEFIDGTKIQPERGKFVMFPATWNFFHRGYPPKSETKYICTGWLHVR